MAAAVLALAAHGCNSAGGQRARGGSTRVVAAESFWGSLAAQRRRQGALVHSVIANPSTDPHTHEPTAADARSVAEATMVIENGIGYDEWMGRLVGASPASATAVLSVGRVLGLVAFYASSIVL